MLRFLLMDTVSVALVSVALVSVSLVSVALVSVALVSVALVSAALVLSPVSHNTACLVLTPPVLLHEDGVSDGCLEFLSPLQL